MRLFVAIELPEHCKKSLGQLRSAIPGARWVAAEQIHLTLAFLGEVDEETSGQLTAALVRIQAPPFELSFAGTGCFPNRRRPRVLWVGVNPEPGLTGLAAKVHDALLACGIAREERPFSPHLTLARLKFTASRELDNLLDSQQTSSLKPFPVTEFTLFQSRLSPQGAAHIPIRSFPLTAPKSTADPD